MNTTRSISNEILITAIGNFVIPVYTWHGKSIPDSVKVSIGSYIELLNAVYHYNTFQLFSDTFSSLRTTLAQRLQANKFSGKDIPAVAFNSPVHGIMAMTYAGSTNNLRGMNIFTVMDKVDPNSIPVNVLIDFYNYHKEVGHEVNITQQSDTERSEKYGVDNTQGNNEKITYTLGGQRPRRELGDNASTKHGWSITGRAKSVQKQEIKQKEYIFQQHNKAAVSLIASRIESNKDFNDFLDRDCNLIYTYSRIKNSSFLSIARKYWIQILLNLKRWYLRRVYPLVYKYFRLDIYDIQRLNIQQLYPTLKNRTYMMLNSDEMTEDMLKVIYNPNLVIKLFEQGWPSFVIYHPKDRQVTFISKINTRTANPLILKRSSTRIYDLVSQSALSLYVDYRVLNLNLLDQYHDNLRRNNVFTLDDIIKIVRTNPSLSASSISKLGQALQ